MKFRALLALLGFKGTFAQRLELALKRPVDLNFEDHGQRRIFVTPQADGRLAIVLDTLFRDIDDSNFKILVDFILKGGEAQKQALIDFLKMARAAHPLPDQVHFLQSELDRLREQYFPNLPAIVLLWGKIGKKGQQKSIRLASFWPQRLEIRMHPLILDERVPFFYQQYLLFHELCHAELILSGKAKSGEHHGDDFYALEDQFPDIESARIWEKQELGQFLTQIQKDPA